METLLGILALISMGWFAVGLINPTKAMFWAKKGTRLRVTGWFVLSVLVIGTAIQVVTPQTQLPQTEQAAPAPATEQLAKAEPPAPAVDSAKLAEEQAAREKAEAEQARQAEEAKKQADADLAQKANKEKYNTYCDYVREYEAMSQDLDFAMGFDPQHGHQPGEIITLESDVVGSPIPKTQSGVVKYFSRSKIKILERYFYGAHAPDLLYKVEGKGISHEGGQFKRGIVVGYIEPIALKLRSDETNIPEFAQRHDAIKEKKAAALKKKYATVLTKDVEVMAFSEDWWGKCLHGN